MYNIVPRRLLKPIETDDNLSLPPVVAWSQTQCSRLTDKTSTLKFFRVQSMALPNGDKAILGGDVIIESKNSGLQVCTAIRTLKIFGC
jgi:hypothetical protein